MSSHTNALFIATLLNFRRLRGEFVEIGVFRGDFSLSLLENWKGEMLHMVDPWAAKGKPRGMHGTNKDYRIASDKVSLYSGRTTIYRRKSEEAVTFFLDGQLDGVYVDGDHRFTAVEKDLNLWWPKIKSGGVFAGHDYRSNCGVPDALNKFVKRHGLKYETAPEEDTDKSNAIWYLFKE